MVWVALAVLIYIAGAIAVQARMRVVPESDYAQGLHISRTRSFSKLLSDTFAQEGRIYGVQTRAKLILRDENLFFLLLSWFTSVCTVLHIIYGTLVFSSTLFISTQDSTGVAGRYVGSVVLCRIVLAYEFSGLRQTIDPSDAQIYVRMDQWYGTQKKSEGSTEVELLKSSGGEELESQPHVQVSPKSTFAMRPLSATA